jgi:predicted RND superfamily exporter protein
LASLNVHRVLYLALAGLVVFVALRSMRRALAPIEPMVHAVVAIVGVAFAMGVAFVLVVAAVLSGT